MKDMYDKKDATHMPKSGGGKGSGISSPFHDSKFAAGDTPMSKKGASMKSGGGRKFSGKR